MAEGENFKNILTTQDGVKIVVSPVLCYINSYLQSCVPDNVKHMTVISFGNDDILEAK